MDSKYAAKIAALLAKAEATTSDEEAQALSAKASELIMKYGIEQAEVDALRQARGEAKGKIIEKAIWFGGTHSLGLVIGSCLVAEAMGGGTLKTLRSSAEVPDYKGVTGKFGDPNRDNRKGCYLFLFGYESDVEQAEVLIASITIQSLSALRRFTRTEDYRNARRWDGETIVKRSFVEGFFAGAAAKIASSRRKVVEEVATSGTEIALRNREQEVGDFVATAYPKLFTARSRSMSWNAMQAGERAGRDADVGHSRVSNARALS